jgi:transglutaminase-like putative cysteine protease
MHRLRATFPHWLPKARYLDGAAREDAEHPAIRALAARFAMLPPAGRAAALFAFVRWAVAYKMDAWGEEFDGAAITLKRGFDDCDGSARLLVALAIAAGLEARIRAVLTEDGQEFEHCQAELRYPGSEGHPLAGPGGWILAELTLAGVELGQGAEAAQIDEQGNYVLLDSRGRS